MFLGILRKNPKPGCETERVCYNRSMKKGNKMNVKCDECERIFDLTDEEQGNEWYYGHDCENQVAD